MSIAVYLLGALIALILLFIAAIHIGFRAPRLANIQTPSDYGLNYQSVQFEGKQQSLLSSWWLEAESQSTTSVVILHGWGANKSIMLPLAKPFVAAGVNVLLLDAHNHGDSEKRGTSSMPKFAEDLDSAISWLKANRPDQSQTVYVMGHSVGAAATLLNAATHPQADGYIAIASFAHPKLMMQRQLGKLNRLPGLVWLINEYVQWVIGHRFEKIAPVTSIQKISKPVLCVHGTADQVIPLGDHQMLCQAANSKQAQCLEIPGADHDSIDLIDQHFGPIQSFVTSN